MTERRINKACCAVRSELFSLLTFRSVSGILAKSSLGGFPFRRAYLVSFTTGEVIMNTLDLIGWTGIVAITAWWLWVNRKIPATKCGHRTYMSGSVMVFGKHVAFRLPVKDGQTDYCLRCIGKMSIRCAWHGEPIVIGDAVTLRQPIAGRTLVDTGGCKSDEAGRYLGCLKCGCLRSDGKGLWVLPGRAQILPVLQEPVTAQV